MLVQSLFWISAFFEEKKNGFCFISGGTGRDFTVNLVEQTRKSWKTLIVCNFCVLEMNTFVDKFFVSSSIAQELFRNYENLPNAARIIWIGK